MRPRATRALAATTLAYGLWLPLPAHAQEPIPSVTLEASPATVDYGGSTILRGRISPETEGQMVQFIDGDGNVRGEATTDPDGRYRVEFGPRENATLRAQWTTAISDPVRVRVRVVVRTRLSDVRLFRKARAFGRIRPAHSGDRVAVELLRNGRVAARRAVKMRGRQFGTRFTIRRPGTYTTRARFDDAEHAAGRDRSRAVTTRLPSLTVGDRADHVKLLEQRLHDLHYFIRSIDIRYDYRTADAVRAFNKVQGKERLGSVTKSTWRALADPKRPRPRGRGRALHIEVDQTKQVLYIVEKGAITNIVHVSTGAGGATQDGVYKIYRKLAGYSGGRLYYPSYFDGLRALHGWPEVPTYPASHGCVRLPMWTAQWVHSVTPTGTKVRVYH